MSFINLSPPASTLIESIRSIGYSFESAIADILDNSISYKAKNISIEVNLRGTDVHLKIGDDGVGMTPDELRVAMSLGGKGPSDFRASDDLGRFGLGLKLASFSQAKKLTVISKSEKSDWYGIQWDLDHVVSTNNWEAFELKSHQIQELLPNEDGLLPKTGTYVCWASSDRIIQNISDKDDLTIHVNRLIGSLKEKLALIFHKYLDKQKLKLLVNGEPIYGLDPFCLKGGPDVPHSTLVFEEVFNIDGAQVFIKGYLLPHASRMGGLTREKQVSIDGDHAAAQGLYLYRLDRLISYGGWQGIVRKSEANKLARVEISLGNDSDSLWQLDVKKSSAILPATIRSRLRDLVRGLSESSKDVFRGRKKLKKTNPNSVWQRVVNKDTNSITYVIDRNHPIVEKFIDEVGDKAEELEDVFCFIESTFPADLISNDLMVDEVRFIPEKNDLDRKIAELADIVSIRGLSYQVFKDTVLNSGLFSHDVEAIENCIKNNQSKFNYDKY